MEEPNLEDTVDGWSNSAKHDKLALLLREECEPVLVRKRESLKKT